MSGAGLNDERGVGEQGRELGGHLRDGIDVDFPDEQQDW
jgi:hypothetical protein